MSRTWNSSSSIIRRQKLGLLSWEAVGEKMLNFSCKTRSLVSPRVSIESKGRGWNSLCALEPHNRTVMVCIEKTMR